ncbi:cell wall hydrolase [Qipengyuania sp. ASV99]|uniref:cell wall hydrolase n=1 Tax=Qipengyuania sp. ASV99 TaxID=3399681 RepID=UPI003A4C5E13
MPMIARRDRRRRARLQAGTIAGALTDLTRLYVFGTVPVAGLAPHAIARYARSRAMHALRKLLGLGPKPAPRVIALPDGRAARMDAAEAARQASATPPRTYRRHIAVLLAAITVPAMAASGDFGELPGAAPTEAELVNAQLAQQLAQNPAMPFERPGMSFPGSAFFFLADPDAGALVALPTFDASAPGAEAGRELGELIDAGPAARPFFSVAGTSHLRAADCLAQAIWYEAASESEAGQRAVAQVVLNRVAHPNWPGSVCGVVYQGSQRSTGCQFTFTCDGSLARRSSGASWVRAQRIAGEALSGSVYEPIGHATHYHTLWVNPYWASSLDHVGTIGAHRFYRNRGAAGQRGAFTGRYAGVEPSLTGNLSGAAEPSAIGGSGADLPALPAIRQSAAAASPASAPSGGTPAAPQPAYSQPILADPALSGAGQVRSDYARAGQWKSGASRASLNGDSTRTDNRPTDGPALPGQ